MRSYCYSLGTGTDANEGAVNGKNQNANNQTLCARAVDKDDSSKLAVAPCFLPNLLAGPCAMT